MIRAFLTALLLVAGLMVHSQEKPYVSIPNKSYRFISGIPKNRQVFLEDSNRIYKALRILEKNWTMDTAFTNGWVEEVNSKRQNFVSLWEDNGNEKQTSLRDTATFPVWFGSYWTTDVLGRNSAYLRTQGGVEQWAIKAANETYESSSGGDAVDQENTYSSLTVNLNGDQRTARLDYRGFHNNGTAASLGTSDFPWDTVYCNNIWPPIPQYWDTTSTAIHQSDSSKYTILGKIGSLAGDADSVMRPDYNNGGRMAMQKISECVFDTAYLTLRIDSMLRVSDSSLYATRRYADSLFDAVPDPPSYSGTSPIDVAGTVISLDTTKAVLFNDTIAGSGKIATKKNIDDAVSSKVSSVSGTNPIVSSGGTTPTISVNSDTLAGWYDKQNKGAVAYSYWTKTEADLVNNNNEGLVTSVSIRDATGFYGNEDGLADGVLNVYSGSSTIPQVHITNDNSATVPAWIELFNYNSGEYFTDNTAQLGKIDFCGPAYHSTNEYGFTKEVGAQIRSWSDGEWRHTGVPPHKNSYRSANVTLSLASGINLNDVMTWRSSGNVGVGTTSPSTTLHVNGVITATGGTSTTWNLAQDSTKNPWKYSGGYTILRGSGNVGIGTTAPISALHLYSGVSPVMYIDGNSVNPLLCFRRDGGATASGAVIGRIAATGHNGTNLMTSNRATFTFFAGETWGAGGNGTYAVLSLTPNSSTTLTETVRFNGDGNVGFGTTNPTDKVTVNGTVNSTAVTTTTVSFSTTPANQAVTGIVGTFTAGENLVFGNVCYMKSDGKLWKADADAESTIPVMAVATASITANATGTFLTDGYIRDDSWSALTIGGRVYCSTTTGAMTQSAPSGSADVVQILGTAIAAKVIKFRPNEMYITLN